MKKTLSLALLFLPISALAEINNESFSSIGFTVGQIGYKESGTLSSGVKFQTTPKTTNLFNYSGGYTAIGDRFGFYINNTSTLSSTLDSESWSAAGTNTDASTGTSYSVDGVFQTDKASARHQALDILAGYLLGSGHQLIGGVSYTQSALDRSGFGYGSGGKTGVLNDFNNANLAPFAGSVSVANSTATTPANDLAALTAAYGADPVGKIRNFTETFSTYTGIVGYRYDTLFKTKQLGSRYQFGATLGIPMHYDVVNTSRPDLSFNSSLEGYDVGLSAGYGWRFTETFSVMLAANYYYRVRPEIKKLVSTRQQSIDATKTIDANGDLNADFPNGVDPGRDRYASIPKNEINYLNFGLAAYWNF